jgi:hypothetical protein
VLLSVGERAEVARFAARRCKVEGINFQRALDEAARYVIARKAEKQHARRTANRRPEALVRQYLRDLANGKENDDGRAEE